MKKLWISLFVLSLILGLLNLIYLPEVIFKRIDLEGNVFGASSRNALIGSILFAHILVNVLFYFFLNLKTESPFFSKLNIPYRKHWMQNSETRKELLHRFYKAMSATGSYVNFLVSSMFYMNLHYYYPEKLYCPRHLLMMLLWLVLSVWVLVYSIKCFSPPPKNWGAFKSWRPRRGLSC